MRLTIIKEDSTVYHDSNIVEDAEMYLVPDDIRVIQWKDPTGCLEYTDGRNENISELPDWAVDTLNLALAKVAPQAKTVTPTENVELEFLRAQKVASINLSAAIEIGKGVEYKGILYDTTLDSRVNITERVVSIADTDTIEWRTKANTVATLSAIEFRELAKAVSVMVDSVHKKSWGYKDALRTATTAEQIQNIIWE